MALRRFSWPQQATVDAFADLGLPWETGELGRKTLVVRNTGGVNGGTYQVLGSLDGGATYPVILQAAANVPAGGNGGPVTIDHLVTHLKIQVKAQLAAAQTTMAAEATGQPL